LCLREFLRMTVTQHLHESLESQSLHLHYINNNQEFATAILLQRQNVRFDSAIIQNFRTLHSNHPNEQEGLVRDSRLIIFVPINNSDVIEIRFLVWRTSWTLYNTDNQSTNLPTTWQHSPIGTILFLFAAYLPKNTQTMNGKPSTPIDALERSLLRVTENLWKAQVIVEDFEQQEALNNQM
jgi:hypothetical protein